MVGTPPSSPRAPDATADAQKEREAALARAEAAEKEAAAAALECDAAAQRARDALARAARERALAAKGAPDADHDAEEDAASVDSDGNTLHHAVLAHEAAALVNLHAQAISVQNIRSLVHVLLDINAGNYTRWRDQIC